MKIYNQSLTILMLFSLFLFFSPWADAQSARNIKKDLSITYTLKERGSAFVDGKLVNKSVNTYSCVRIQHYYYSAKRETWVPLPLVELLDLNPRSVKNYQLSLPFRDIQVNLKSVEECRSQRGYTEKRDPRRASTAKNSPKRANTEKRLPRRANTKKRPPRQASKEKNPPRQVRVGSCSITGRISGKLTWDTKGDRGEPVSFTLEDIYMKRPGIQRPMHTRIRGNKYTFNNVPAGQKYTVFPGGFRSNPGDIVVVCQPNKIYKNKNFNVTGPPLYGG